MAIEMKGWQPGNIERVIRVIDTSTKPLHVVTDKGTALVKYMGNPAGNDALVCEIMGGHLARCIGLETPDFAVAKIPEISVLEDGVITHEGPAFFSRWEESTPLSPGSSLLANIRHPEHIAWLVVFDTWLRNKDRFSDSREGEYNGKNFDNVLLKADKRKVKLLVIDHTHAFAETTLDDELDQEWIDEQIVYGRFEEFVPYLTRTNVRTAIEAIQRIDLECIQQICRKVPREWGMTSNLTDRLSECLKERGEKLADWVPYALFDQLEMNV